MLVVVLVTKFLAGAWITILAMGVFFAIMRAIRATTTGSRRSWWPATSDPVLPTRVHAIVLVSKLHKPTMRALAYAKASRPNIAGGRLRRLDGGDTARLVDEWDAQRIDVPLKVLHSPYREVVRPIVEYAVEIREANPRGSSPSTSRSTSSGAGGSSCCTTRPPCGSRAGCSSRRASW